MLPDTRPDNWYKELKKPSWAPHSWVFGPVWSFLYALMILSFGTVFLMIFQNELTFMIALPFILNLIFNFSFTFVQFILKSNMLASIDIILLWITIVWIIIAIYPIAPWIAYIQLPYLLWVSFAAILQFAITFLNRKSVVNQ